MLASVFWKGFRNCTGSLILSVATPPEFIIVFCASSVSSLPSLSVALSRVKRSVGESAIGLKASLPGRGESGHPVVVLSRSSFTVGKDESGGECGGVWILTFFVRVDWMEGAAAHCYFPFLLIMNSLGSNTCI